MSIYLFYLIFNIYDIFGHDCKISVLGSPY